MLKNNIMDLKSILMMVLIIGGWLILFGVILPMLGINTWLKKSCPVPGEQNKSEKQIQWFCPDKERSWDAEKMNESTYLNVPLFHTGISPLTLILGIDTKAR